MASISDFSIEHGPQRPRRQRYHVEVGGQMQQAAIEVSGADGAWGEKMRSVSSDSLSTTEASDISSPCSSKDGEEGYADQASLCLGLSSEDTA
eukprot:CAMPEP_0181463588 /NCGR_PEP_ID=MMETSP1110-20121109/34991_1 /TAXON_ID=174948 /ORGANISM="Symbiodinium sp., Strain CCMP421" /LENGTH=92 /DNA_ID=CAMNT_0023588289 /DNA_START=53 /DNA_END=331 /DNA_ORIENTATION=-